MFDRFTDRARKTMGLARQAAQRWNHDYIGTEHILCGLVDEGTGVAATVLKSLGVDPLKVREELQKLVDPGTTRETMGQLPFTACAKRVLEGSLEEAERLGDNHIGTEHLLLGLLREEGSIAAKVLRKLNLGIEDARAEVRELLGLEPEATQTQRSGRPPLEVGTRLIELLQAEPAASEQERSSGPHVGGRLALGWLVAVAVEKATARSGLIEPEHVLLAMLRDPEGKHAKWLATEGVNVAEVRAKVERMLKVDPPAGGASPTP